MKAVIQEVKFLKEWESKYGIMFNFQVKYDDQVALFTTKSKDQKKFIAGEEVEFTEETKTYTDKKSGELKEYIVIKPINPNKQSNFGKALKKEQTRYSGFAVSYAKDLVVAGRLDRNELPEYATMLFELMVTLDKSTE
jgi:glucose dehydrogenase